MAQGTERVSNKTIGGEGNIGTFFYFYQSKISSKTAVFSLYCVINDTPIYFFTSFLFAFPLEYVPKTDELESSVDVNPCTNGLGLLID